MKDINGTYTVITGASSGIGREAARAFAQRGNSLVLSARRADRLESLRQEILEEHPDCDVVTVPADLESARAACELYEAASACSPLTWINCAGFGSYGSVPQADASETSRLVALNCRSVAVLSSLFTRDHMSEAGAQLINVSSAGGYTIVPEATTYCATKFFVSAFTEGLAHELHASGSPMRAKVFAPAATQTEFGQIASHTRTYVYEERFAKFHTAREAAQLLLRLHDSDATVGLVDRETFEFRLSGPLLLWAGGSTAT